MPYRINGRSSLVAFTFIASATAVGSGLLLFERLKGTDTSKDFAQSAQSFSLLASEKKG